jgi:hypothetical protein
MGGRTLPAYEPSLTAVAAESYIFLYPLVTMELTRLQATNIEAGRLPGRGPMNEFIHIRQFPDADFKVVVRPNFDTLYSSAWLDLTAEPVIVSAADTGGRFYMLPMLDMWTDVFAVPGQRTSGTSAANWAVVPQGWEGQLPAGVERIDAPTPHVWIIGRTQANGPSDYDAVYTVQDGFGISPLSEWGSSRTTPNPPIDPDVDMTTPPLDQVNAMSGEDFFTLGAELMRVHPPHVIDWSQVRRMRRLGIVPGQSFDVAALDAEARRAVSDAPEEGRKRLMAELPTMAVVTNGWQMNTSSIGLYGAFYSKRAVVSMLGLGANPPEDAVYPLLMADADGDKVDGSQDYVLHFAKSELPPVSAFWSITMYDDHGFQVSNELNRFALGDRDPLEYNADGSLDLYIQHANPGSDRQSNWLPAPNGPSGITMRLYLPDVSVLAGAWAPPPVQKT